MNALTLAILVSQLVQALRNCASCFLSYTGQQSLRGEERGEREEGRGERGETGEVSGRGNTEHISYITVNSACMKQVLATDCTALLE